MAFIKHASTKKKPKAQNFPKLYSEHPIKTFILNLRKASKLEVYQYITQSVPCKIIKGNQNKSIKTKI
jgi:hypothetical protein